jgi:hypothetical protein
VRAARLIAELLKLGELRLGFLQDGNIRTTTGARVTNITEFTEFFSAG